MMDRPPGFRVFHGVAMLFVVLLVVSNTIAVKVIEVGGFVLPAGIICFPAAYIFNDCLVETYGYKKARSVIWIGFGCLALMSALYFIATLLPPAPFWQEDAAFGRLFQSTPRIALGSFAAYLVGSYLNAVVMSWMKVKTEGRFLWARTISSTVVGEAADSFIFNFVAFLGVFEFSQVVQIAISGFILKTLYEIIATPGTYAIAGWLKRVEGEDTFDRDVTYNPFWG